MACPGGEVSGPKNHLTALEFESGFWAYFSTGFDIPGSAFGDFTLNSRSDVSSRFKLEIKSPNAKNYRVFGENEDSINIRIDEWSI